MATKRLIYKYDESEDQFMEAQQMYRVTFKYADDPESSGMEIVPFDETPDWYQRMSPDGAVDFAHVVHRDMLWEGKVEKIVVGLDN
jgi:hypothetical protein